jgi:hypothetical protein
MSKCKPNVDKYTTGLHSSGIRDCVTGSKNPIDLNLDFPTLEYQTTTLSQNIMPNHPVTQCHIQKEQTPKFHNKSPKTHKNWEVMNDCNYHGSCTVIPLLVWHLKKFRYLTFVAQCAPLIYTIHQECKSCILHTKLHKQVRTRYLGIIKCLKQLHG